MIIGQEKPVTELLDMIKPYKRVLVLGCGTCTTVSLAGGEKEAEFISALIRLNAAKAGRDVTATTETVKRQCEWEFLDDIADLIEQADAVLSFACGVGVQAIAERYPDKVVLPGVNTKFMGMPIDTGVFQVRCAGCGNCILDKRGGICPIARCSKSLLNGPCGGAEDGKCEVNPEIDCAWYLIYNRLKAIGRLDDMKQFFEPKDWSYGRHGGARKLRKEGIAL
ncbi:methylenetetrahydrofolate reductase C-terminal domain-containing protein [Mahella australiensis]|uniref:Methylene-tetrahydrofolate reductase C-terminal-like domain-containing protein n=1 Tax=Mahella australiensis (strain DSM 15567 / CIP 107919 / 50-1 BON) TaxID=697281 RepID=F4A1X4_MAHA5|nr:methylenetetrahydrofolate reductase C-terminal domain-containing protein [Mahella australiensis]AEE96090.1 hypothetical protein Mahau_0892 [Mahella australiensis 50-1 BON]